MPSPRLSATDAGNDDNRDSDPNVNSGKTASFSANRGSQQFTSWDAGLVFTLALTELNDTAEELGSETPSQKLQPEAGESTELSVELETSDLTLFPNPATDYINAEVQIDRLVPRQGFGKISSKQLIDGLNRSPQPFQRI